MRRPLLIAAFVTAACSAAWAEGTRPDAHAAAQFSPAGITLAQAAPAPAPVQAQPPAPPTPQERIAMLKQWLQASQAQLRSYEWVETTVISQGGAEKSRQEKQCYYGADGRVQKMPLSQSSSEKGGPPGVLPFGKLARKAAENKKEEVTAYMTRAAELVHAYVPPDPGRIQQSVDTGKASVNVVQPGRLVRLDFRDYLKPGDLLGVEVELPTNRLVRVSVSTYLDTPADAVGLTVGMGGLPDGTIYPLQTDLDAKAKGVRVTVQNSGYRRTAR